MNIITPLILIITIVTIIVLHMTIGLMSMRGQGVEQQQEQVIRLQEKVDTQGVVSIAVMPYQEEGQWSFRISMNTHSHDLTANMIEAAVLKDAVGNTFHAIVWEGDSPGGHHRNGTLRFDAISETETLMLTLHDVGGVVERRYMWDVSRY